MKTMKTDKQAANQFGTPRLETEKQQSVLCPQTQQKKATQTGIS